MLIIAIVTFVELTERIFRGVVDIFDEWPGGSTESLCQTP
jgi:hypothetical protein